MDSSRIDHVIISFLKRAFIPFARFALFIIYAWFGFLKLIGLSPAGVLVQQLFSKTIHFMPFHTFYILFALFEILIGILFLFPRLIRIAIPFLFLHMITTVLPLFTLPSVTWQSFLVPTMEGQYIIKNFAILAIAVGIAAHTHPIRERENH